MPYVIKQKRYEITPHVNFQGGEKIVKMDNIQCAGDLNYAFTMLALNYVRSKGIDYQAINDVIGAFVCAKDEFQRRLTGNYEDTKINMNGDVYVQDIKEKDAN